MPGTGDGNPDQGGILYVVATPIGNLEDITLRALRVLREVDLIAAEDTRRTKKLLTHYGICRPLVSYFEHKERREAGRLVQRLLKGERIALVSDAGSPSISDPGYRLVRGARLAGVPVVPIPGPTAPIALLSASGLPTDRFIFEGFFPRRKGARIRCLEELLREKRTAVFFESRERVRETLGDIAAILGKREILLGREMSKVHEEIVGGTAEEILSRLGDERTRGEFTLAIAGAGDEGESDSQSLLPEIQELRKEGMPLKEIVECLSAKTGSSKRAIYQAALALLSEKRDDP
jgi:16S rRNA (cytidine1402-2'-O)-methyltransferase